ncbi:Uncharacterised protein [Mycobacteroides abscessus]|nr:Uncharacterised protein [Mycobacteroides abscessus]
MSCVPAPGSFGAKFSTYSSGWEVALTVAVDTRSRVRGTVEHGWPFTQMANASAKSCSLHPAYSSLPKT